MSPKKMKIISVVGFSIYLCLLSSTLVFAVLKQGCPDNSREIGRTTINDEIVIDCKCDVGFQLSQNMCISISDKQPGQDKTPGVTTRQMALLTGRAVQALLDSVRQYGLEQQDNPARRIEFRIGLWHAERGQYTSARQILAATTSTTDDPVLEDFGRALKALAEEELGALSVISKDPALTRVRSHLVAGDYQAAAAACNKHPQIRHAINAFGETHQTTQEIISKKRKEAAANAGLKLADHLSEHDSFSAAIVTLRQSAEIFSSLGLIETAADTLWMAESYVGIEPDKAKVTASDPQPFFPIGYDSKQAYFTKASRADLILDALDYGAGDWQRSISYLEIAQKVDADNLMISRALAYVRAASMTPP